MPGEPDLRGGDRTSVGGRGGAERSRPGLRGEGKGGDGGGTRTPPQAAGDRIDRQRRRADSGRSRASCVREWAEPTGREVDKRGAFPGHIEEVYAKAEQAGELQEDEKVPTDLR
ncbi:Lsr2 family protein [Streptomyces smyrnaeus]|uniref:Lsr2 family protein n=1 Tax=Streptomyces smyrnaeus TaxID=1387713 RepID=A0ABS3Y4K6_9ACTN|nr:Lsr2 family protein [Streptomyces smyrnaeus]